MLRKIWAVSLILLLAFSLSLAEDYSFSQYLNIKSASAPALSADGKQVAFLTNITGTRQIWVVDDKGGWPNQITFYQNTIGDIFWSPDGKWILFEMDKDGNEKFQLYLISPDGSHTIQLTDKPNVIHSFGGWLKDGHNIAFSSNERNEAFFDIYVMDIRTKQPQLVYQKDALLETYGFSPDNQHLIVKENITNLNANLYLFDFASSTAKLLTPHKGDAVYDYISWTPDSRGFYLCSDQNRDFVNLAFYDVKSRKLKFIEHQKRDIEELEISEDGKLLAYVENDNGYGVLKVRNLETGEDLAPLALRGIATGLEFSKDGNRLAYSYVSPTSNADIQIYDFKESKKNQVTNSTKAGIPQESFMEPNLIKYKSFDGLEIPAFFYLPKSGETMQKNPVILYIHGGPEAQERPFFSIVFQYFISRGYAIFAPNIRGSTGYGKKYTHLDDIKLRGNAIKDVVYAAEYLKNHRLIDPDKIVIYGGSYGGYMTLAAITFYPDLWAAAVDIVGIANFETFLQNTGAWRRKLREAEYGYLDKDIQILRKFSPIHYVENIKTPLFVIQGANDQRVPKSEAEQIVESVKAKGGIVEYLLFEDEGHGLSKLPNRIKGYSAIADFLDKYVKGKP
ncbi:MAG TPA: S9 family peptidase [candidate division Zixibacteria bacterium]|nr:S9 family peptidase [candidate division Zixibacteria bacterium]